MSVSFLSTRALAQLREGIPAAQNEYVAGRVASVFQALGAGCVHESRIPAGDPPSLLLPAGSQKNDEENVERIHRWLGHLTPVQASDPRLWVCLTHTRYADYTAARWPVESGSNVSTVIRERYFMEGEGLASITRNSIARLWWFGHLTIDPSRPDKYEWTKVLLSLQDIQQAFLERTIGRSRRLLQTALRLWKRRIEQAGTPEAQGRVVQKWARLIRLHGAVVVLDTLSDQALENLLWAKLATALNETLPELEIEDVS
jgi:hypothetical protein